MPRIRLLPDTLINQIAAGEVVERPASVVKELVENALDAGARAVHVRLTGGGRELVEVEDDGCGMDGEDAILALERHATSKIACAEDLAAIATLGFRGEALPSIAAASRLVLETAATDGDGTRVEVEFGRLLERRPFSRPRGTRVSARDLFARLPARRKFLRSEATELRHVASVVSALAFTHPAVAFTLEHGRRVLLRLPVAREAAARLPDLAGAARARAAREVQHTAASFAVTGFLLPGRGAHEAVLAVNGRVVRDRMLVAICNRALRGPSGQLQADAYLDLHLPPGEVDVNVHPTKAEVRFADPSRVAAVLAAALAQAVTTLHGPVEVRRVVTVSPPPPSGPSPRPLPLEPPWAAEAAPPPYAAPVTPTSAIPWGSYLGQYRQTYLVVESNDGLLLVDQHVAHERVLYERLLARSGPAAVQRLLVPEVVELAPAHAVLAEEFAEELRGLGLEIEPASGHAVRVLGVPATLSSAGGAALLERLLADLEAAPSPGHNVRERAAASMACQAAIKKNRPLTRPEAEHLLRELADAQEPHRCPHGRPILLRLSHAEIEHRIGRR